MLMMTIYDEGEKMQAIFAKLESLCYFYEAVVIAGVKYENITITPANGDEMPVNEFFELINDNQQGYTIL